MVGSGSSALIVSRTLHAPAFAYMCVRIQAAFTICLITVFCPQMVTQWPQSAPAPKCLNDGQHDVSLQTEGKACVL